MGVHRLVRENPRTGQREKLAGLLMEAEFRALTRHGLPQKVWAYHDERVGDVEHLPTAQREVIMDDPWNHDITAREVLQAHRARMEQERCTVTPADQARLARWWADQNGYEGRRGGWIYTSTGLPVAQGWRAFYRVRRAAIERAVLDQEHPISGPQLSRSAQHLVAALRLEGVARGGG